SPFRSLLISPKACRPRGGRLSCVCSPCPVTADGRRPRRGGAAGTGPSMWERWMHLQPVDSCATMKTTGGPVHPVFAKTASQACPPVHPSSLAATEGKAMNTVSKVIIESLADYGVTHAWGVVGD